MTHRLKVLVSIALLSLTAAVFVPAHALECANAGTAPGTPPDDTGDGGATACGFQAIAGGNDSTALGYLANSTGARSTSLGYNSSSAGFESLAQGYNAQAGGNYSTALGWSAVTSGSSSVALGSSASATGLHSVAVGFRATAPNPDTIVLGSIDGQNGAAEYADVAIGTTAPLAPLHVTRSDGTASILVEETNAAAAPRTLFMLANPGNTKFEIMNTDAGNSWAFTNSGSDFRISRQGSGVVEFRVDNLGNAYVANDLEVGGDLFTNVNVPSDRNLKQNFEVLDAEQLLAKVAALPVTAWEYANRPGERHIGPMAQDFHAAFGLGTSDTTISVVDASGVALASIKALNEKLDSQNAALAARSQELDARNAALEAEVTSLREELETVKAVVSGLVPQTVRN